MSVDIVPAADLLEVSTLASEMATAYKRMAAFYRDQMGMMGPVADAHARGMDATPEEAAADTQRIRDRPPDQIGWFDLTRLAERDPAEAAAQWQRLRAAARDEFGSGHRTADALEWQGSPWDRARFLAVRDSFRGNTPPASGIEAALIDSAAEAFTNYLEWTEQLQRMVSIDMRHEEQRSDQYREWQPQRLGYAEAIARASGMAESAHARFLRTVKMLHEVRKYAPAVYVGHAGQVNVGQQQVNVSTPEDTQER